VFIALAVLRRGGASWGFRAEWKSLVSRVLILLSAGLGLLATIWYFWNLRDVLQHIRDASSGAISLRYGLAASPIVKFGTWARLLGQSFGEPYLLWVLLLVCLAGVASRYSPKTQGWLTPSSTGRAMVLISAVQVVILLVTLSFGDAVDARYLYAILPCAVIIVMWLCAFSGSRTTVAVFSALCALQWILLHGVALGAVSYVADQSKWLLPLQGDAHDFEELMRVVRATAVDGRYDIIGVEEAWFNANSAAFFAAKNRLDTGSRGFYTSLGYAQTDVKAALGRIDQIRAKYVLTLDEQFQRNPPDFLNVVSLPILEQLRRGGQFKAIPFRSDKGILVFERLDSPSSWTILSSIFPSGAATGTDGAGQGWWRIHPSRRRAGEPTRVQYDIPLPADSVFSGNVESCDKRCQGIEIVLNVSGPPDRDFGIRLPGPLEGKHIEAALKNSAGQRLSVDIRSIDPDRDNIDYCWVTIKGINVASR
jgi:hypothetical protein